jgi:hypothetical protein
VGLWNSIPFLQWIPELRHWPTNVAIGWIPEQIHSPGSFYHFIIIIASTVSKFKIKIPAQRQNLLPIKSEIF